MATCGHHYPTFGCHNCWLWLREEADELRAVLDELKQSGAVSACQVETAMDRVEEAWKARKGTPDA